MTKRDTGHSRRRGAPRGSPLLDWPPTAQVINLSQDRRGARREIDEIKKATDGRLDLEVPELPELQVMAKRTVDIPEVVRDAAAKLTGLPESDFTIDVGY